MVPNGISRQIFAKNKTALDRFKITTPHSDRLHCNTILRPRVLRGFISSRTLAQSIVGSWTELKLTSDCRSESPIHFCGIFIPVFSPKQRKKLSKYSFQIQKKYFSVFFYEILKDDFFSKVVKIKK